MSGGLLLSILLAGPIPAGAMNELRAECQRFLERAQAEERRGDELGWSNAVDQYRLVLQADPGKLTDYPARARDGIERCDDRLRGVSRGYWDRARKAVKAGDRDLALQLFRRAIWVDPDGNADLKAERDDLVTTCNRRRTEAANARKRSLVYLPEISCNDGLDTVIFDGPQVGDYPPAIPGRPIHPHP